MKDPLTIREFNEFASNVRKQLRHEYDRALDSGAFDSEEYGEAHDHRILKIALRHAALMFAPMGKQAREDAVNYAQF